MPPSMRPTIAQLFYKKNIQLAPYNQAELGLIITLESDPEAPVSAAEILEALQVPWEQIQQFVHGQEAIAFDRHRELNPPEIPLAPRRNGRASFTPVEAQVIEQLPGERAEPPHPAEFRFPATQEPVPSAVQNPPKTPEEAQARYFARYGDKIGGGTLEHIRTYIGDPTLELPTTTDTWMALAARTRAEVTARDAQEQQEQHTVKVSQAKQVLADAESRAAKLGATIAPPTVATPPTRRTRPAIERK